MSEELQNYTFVINTKIGFWMSSLFNLTIFQIVFKIQTYNSI